MERVTLKDIATITGSAVSTVSAALNGTGRISPATVKTIRDAAQELGFRDNLAAKLLKNKQVEIFGLAVSDRVSRIAGHGVYSELQEKFITECHAENIRTQFGVERSGQVPAVLLDGIARGVVHAGYMGTKLLKWLEKNPKFPFVSFEEPWKYCVRTDFAAGVYRAVQYLAATGHERIGLFCGPPEYDLPRQMVEGFERGCRDFGRTLVPGFMKNHSMASGYEHHRDCVRLLDEFFAGPVVPDAIIAAGQGFSMVAVAELPKRGVWVPRDLSLIGVCSSWEAERIYPELCAIERDMPRLVTEALRMLKQLTRGVEPRTPQLLVPANFEQRASVRSRF